MLKVTHSDIVKVTHSDVLKVTQSDSEGDTVTY